MAWPIFEELSSSPEGVIDRSGNSIERRFKVGRDDLINFIQYLCDGGTSGWSGTPAPSVVLPNTYLSAVRFSPLAGDEQHPVSKVITNPLTATNEYKHWLVTATYSLYPFNLIWPSAVPKPAHRANTTLKLQIKGSKEYKTFAARFLRWSSSGPVAPGATGTPDTTNPVPQDMPARIMIPTIDFVVEWDLVLDPPINTFMAAVGHCNYGAFLGCSSETLLLDDYDVQESMRLSTTYPWAYKCLLNFRFRYVGWNMEFREDPPGWAYIICADGTPRHPPLSMTNIFA